MSEETVHDLNSSTLIGNTDARGTAWHYRAEHQGDEPNHYPGPIPVADVQRRLEKVPYTKDFKSPYAPGNSGQISADGRSVLLQFEITGDDISAPRSCPETSTRLSAFGAKRTCGDRGWRIDRARMTHSGHRPDRNPAVQQTFAGPAPSLGTAGGRLYGRPSD